MKLTYRGVQYDYTPPVVETVDNFNTGKYRGVDIRFRTVKKNPVQQPTLDLVYRGVAHTTGEHTSESVAPATAPIVDVPNAIANVESKARAILLGHHRSVKRRQQSMLTRLAVEVGLDEKDNHYWNHIQGKVHPSFWATYDRSHTAAS